MLRDHISVHDRGLLYGDGVFETVRCRNGKLLLQDLHLRRLLSSCQRLGITLDPSAIESWWQQLAAAAPAQDNVLKIIVTRGEGGRGYAPPAQPACTLLAQWHALPPALDSGWQDGIDCMLCDYRLSENAALAGLKHLNRLDQVMASRELAAFAAEFPSVREGLTFDQHNYLVEGTRTNLFVVIDGHICTPDLSTSGVAGVMREWILQTLAEQNIPVETLKLDRETMLLASGMFICNSVFGIWPVNRLVRLENNQVLTLKGFDDNSVCRSLQTKARTLFFS